MLFWTQQRLYLFCRRMLFVNLIGFDLILNVLGKQSAHLISFLGVRELPLKIHTQSFKDIIKTIAFVGKNAC